MFFEGNVVWHEATNFGRREIYNLMGVCIYVYVCALGPGFIPLNCCFNSVFAEVASYALSLESPIRSIYFFINSFRQVSFD